MAAITKLIPSAHRQGYLEIEVDGALLGAIPERLAEERGLARGQELDEAELAELRAAARISEALTLANRFLGHRPRSSAEVRARLRRERFDPEVIDACLGELERHGLLDDRRFAALWVENRVTFSPRSARSLEQELRSKGIDRDVVEETLAASDSGGDAEMAVQAGRRRLHSMARLDEETFRRRMGGFLARRGFNYEAAAAAIAQLWAERDGNPASGA
ncbi:MAG TPA: regulatory protein RecX [Chloroflexota bacterium]|nr:regulatory protein RecX [Chloroflexota bacterium]